MSNESGDKTPIEYPFGEPEIFDFREEDEAAQMEPFDDYEDTEQEDFDNLYDEDSGDEPIEDYDDVKQEAFDDFHKDNPVNDTPIDDYGDTQQEAEAFDDFHKDNPVNDTPIDDYGDTQQEAEAFDDFHKDGEESNDDPIEENQQEAEAFDDFHKDDVEEESPDSIEENQQEAFDDFSKYNNTDDLVDEPIDDYGDTPQEVFDNFHKDESSDDNTHTDETPDDDDSTLTTTESLDEYVDTTYEWYPPAPEPTYTTMYPKTDPEITREIAISAIVREIPWYIDYFYPIVETSKVGLGRIDDAGISIPPAAPAEWISVSRSEPTVMPLANAIRRRKNPLAIARKTITTHLYVLEGLCKLAYYDPPIIHNNISTSTVLYESARGAPLLSNFSFAFTKGDHTNLGIAVETWKGRCVEIRLLAALDAPQHDTPELSRDEVFALREVGVAHAAAELREAGISDEAAAIYMDALNAFLDTWIGETRAAVRNVLWEGCQSWDVYSLSRLYLDILKDVFDDGEWVNAYRMVLVRCILVPPGNADERETPSAMWETVKLAAGKMKGAVVVRDLSPEDE